MRGISEACRLREPGCKDKGEALLVATGKLSRSIIEISVISASSKNRLEEVKVPPPSSQISMRHRLIHVPL